MTFFQSMDNLSGVSCETARGVTENKHNATATIWITGPTSIELRLILFIGLEWRVVRISRLNVDCMPIFCVSEHRNLFSTVIQIVFGHRFVIDGRPPVAAGVSPTCKPFR